MANDINEMKSRKAKTPLEKVADSEKNIILITGIGGFLGFSLSKVLAQDYVVIGLDRESECSKYPDCVSCDLSSDRSVKKAMDELRTRVGNRFASVIHLSGYYDFTGEPNPLYEEVNVNGTHRLTMAWARIANAAVGLWLLFAPLVFWTPSAAAYLNDTLVGSLVIGFAILARPMPGIGLMASMTGPDIPPGWDYSPLSWTQRIPIIFLAFIGLYVSRYLAAYQLGHIGSAWDPYFGNGTETIITSDVSKAWPVPDAGLGAVTYILEILTGIIGGRNRWRTMPWLVILFGVMIVPLGAVSIFFIIIQPILLGTWCTLCLFAAVAMLIQIPYSVDELVATGQFLAERRRKGKSVLLAFMRGDILEGGSKMEPESFEGSFWAIIKDMLGGGVSLPWSLVLSTAIGVWLMCTRLIFTTQSEQANSDHLIGALVITISITALGETARPARFINVLLAIPLIAAPWMLDGGSLGADWSGVIAGLLLILLSIPRGKIENHYGSWSRYLI